MLLLALVLTFLPRFINAQCNRNLVLPWGNYLATYDDTTKLCAFLNVRFAGPPTGELRFQAPRDPLPSDPPAPSGPISCLRGITPWECSPSNDLFLSNDQCSLTLPGTYTEDCLFLDIYVPASVLNGNTQVPVVVWFYGGAYLFGSKDEFNITQIPLYSGQGVLEATSHPIIFVAGNYRVGPFGWLAGTYVEQNALPNAGLYDQRKVLEFVQSYISKINGDPQEVSAWGESAGAGSILHHLLSVDGTQDPLFSKAVLQSPAFQWQWNRTGSLNETYSQFASYAGCKNGDLKCLQLASTDALIRASEQLFNSITPITGLFPLGPSVDGKLIKTLPAVAFQQGKYWAKLSSIIVSRVADEIPASNTNKFLPCSVREAPTYENYENFISAFLPGADLKDVRNRVIKQYPFPKDGTYQQKLTVIATLVRDSSFTCNTRQLFDAYTGKTDVYMMNYRFLDQENLAIHASDLLPTFFHRGVDIAGILHKCQNLTEARAQIVGAYFNSYARSYLSYLKSHALTGDPNKYHVPQLRRIRWPLATTNPGDNHDKVRQVLEPYLPTLPYVQPPFSVAPEDLVNTARICGFWNEIAADITEIVNTQEQHESSLLSLTVQGPERVLPSQLDLEEL